MKKETKKKSCKCKHICRDCLNILEYGCPEHLTQPECNAYPTKEMDCITGDINTIYALCSEKNKNGDCKKYKLNQPDADKKKLIRILGKFKATYHPMDWACRDDIIGELITDLLRTLNDKESTLMELTQETSIEDDGDDD